MFGLAQLYQLRGRVGRSKTRAYAYFTTPVGQRLTEGAEKRLKVLQSLDQLGAGFSLASHDLDIRGAGNLLGDEQSGHIREVGFELYQAMLEETIEALKGGDIDGTTADQWSPQIQLGMPVLLPESYVADLQVRLGLYRRLSSLVTREQIDQFAAELIDRFGPLPAEAEALLDVMELKALCRRAGVAQLDAGTKGASIAFRKGAFANPDALVRFIAASKGLVKVQPDSKLVFRAEWEKSSARMKGVQGLLTELAAMAEGK
jgi:transcription-repair coupling factor (superfamily II helicase)